MVPNYVFGLQISALINVTFQQLIELSNVNDCPMFIRYIELLLLKNESLNVYCEKAAAPHSEYILTVSSGCKLYLKSVSSPTITYIFGI